jgi:arylsulfatase A-like enzyme
MFRLLFFAALTVTATAADRPNVVIIYGDDVGYGDVGAYGCEAIPTPNIDKLAAGGIRFTDGHASAPTCTPSRFSLLTGVHGFRHNASILPPNAPLLIPTDAYTLPRLFKDAGYKTAVIGKWHLGLGKKGTPVDWNGDVKPGPLELGFDYSFLLPSTNDRVPCVYLENHRVVNLDPADPLYVTRKHESPDPKSTVYPDGRKDRAAMTYYPSTQGHNNSVINGIGRIGYQWGGKSALWNDETMADVFVDKTKEYIKANKDEPFFLYFASQDIHVPRAPHPRFQGKTKLGYRGDAMVQFDWTVGEIMKSLDENGLTENTIIIFSSDNGPVYDDGYKDGTTVHTSREESDNGHDGSGIYRGGKYQIYEGGTRVPFIVRWPNKIKPAVSDALVNQIDLLGSFAALLETEIPKGHAIDSRNALDALIGKDPKGYSYMLVEGPVTALRHGAWKYIPAGRKSWGARAIPESLFNLADDPSEQNNLLKEFPEKAAHMKQKLQEMKQANGVNTLQN